MENAERKIIVSDNEERKGLALDCDLSHGYSPAMDLNSRWGLINSLSGDLNHQT